MATQTAAQIEQTVQGMQVGQRWGQKCPEWHLFVRRPTADEYRLVATWAVPEINDEDPGSYNCGCALQGKSHVHAEQPYAASAIGALAATYLTAKDEILARRPVSFAPSRRIGG